VFDLHFPDACDAEDELVRRILQGGANRGRKPLGFTVPPDEDVGVQKDSHGSPVQKPTGSGSSKSSLAVIAPSLSPATRFPVDLAIGTRRATGRSAWAKTTSVPDNASDTSSETCASGFSMSTVFVITASHPGRL